MAGMEERGKLVRKVPVELSTVVIVRNRCQFCYAFYMDAEKIAEHSERCEFRFSDSFEAFDGKVKFACAVCFDVFETRAEHTKHEQRHRFPGGFPCLMCEKVFLNNLECVQHMETDHKVYQAGLNFGNLAFKCNTCGAIFQQESYLSLHKETNCGRHRNWHCNLCGPDLLTKDAYKKHMETEHKPAPDDVEDVFIMPTVEVTLNKNLNSTPIQDFPKKDSNLDDLSVDPLLLMVKDEKYIDADMDDISNSNYSLPDENSIKTFSEPSVTDDPTSTDHIPKIGIGERYICKYCDRKYIFKKTFIRHIVKHGRDGSLLHRCDCCNVYFATRQQRNSHAKTEHREKLKCKICDKLFLNAGSLNSHERASHKKVEAIAECDVEKITLETDERSGCPTAAENTSERTAERNNSGNALNPEADDFPELKIPYERKFKCTYCGRKYRSKNGLRRHMEDHGPDGSLLHRCDCCTMYFKTKEERDKHLQTVCEKIVCTICNRTFRGPDRLQHHNRTFHAGGMVKEKRKQEKRLQEFCCIKCGKRFTQKTYLDNHELSDCGRTPRYKCDVCGKRLATKGSLKIHTMTHTDERNFSCSFCSKAFRNNTGLLLHTRYQHTNERPFKCDNCEKSFVDLTSLKVHKTIHTGIKRYVCYGCGDRYPTNSALHKHRNARKNTCALVPIQKPLKIPES